MVDVFDPQKRSEVMSRIRSTGTVCERRLYQAIRGVIGGRKKIYRNAKHLPGKPDLVIPCLKLAIFVDGCFYHCCPVHGHIPQSNREYWEPKLLRNVERDKQNRRKLRACGYGVWRFWEHQLEGRQWGTTEAQLQRRLAQRRTTVA